MQQGSSVRAHVLILPFDQGGGGRHKCAGCAYEAGLAAGIERRENVGIDLDGLEVSQAGTVAEAMVRAFTAAGEHDTAIEIEARTRGDAALFDGANMAMARAAQALRERGAPGDAEEARRLARRVSEAWRHADQPVPILAELRQLLR